MDNVVHTNCYLYLHDHLGILQLRVLLLGRRHHKKIFLKCHLANTLLGNFSVNFPNISTVSKVFTLASMSPSAEFTPSFYCDTGKATFTET